MNTREALRQADPARRLPAQPAGDSEERLLQEILAALPDRPSGSSSSAISSARPARAARDWKPAIATAVVAVAVVAGTIVAIRSTSAPVAAGSATATANLSSRETLESAVFARLSTVASGDRPVREQLAQTWTDETRGSDGGPIDLTGKDLFIAAACDGGGSIAIRETGRADLVLRCGSPSTIGPIDLTSAVRDGDQTSEYDIIVTSGHPRYVAKAMAFTKSTTSR